jgi:hypothetical protein
MPMAFIRSLSAVLVATSIFLLAPPALAELPPQFTTWADFAAVTAQRSIPYVLGTVDAIERTPDGKYIVRAGSCFVEATVVRESGVAPDGKIVVGPTRIVRVSVGEKRCK